MKETDKKIYDFKSDVLFKYSLADESSLCSTTVYQCHKAV